MIQDAAPSADRCARGRWQFLPAEFERKPRFSAIRIASATTSLDPAALDCQVALRVLLVIMRNEEVDEMNHNLVFVWLG